MEAQRNSSKRNGPGNPPSSPADSQAWRAALPELTAGRIRLREPVAEDAAALLMALGPHDLRECAPLTATPSIAGMEALVADAHAHRRAGTALCWAVVPVDSETPVGVLVVHALDFGFTMATISAVIASEFRGTGVFQDAARCLLDFLFGTFGIHRVEMRVDVRNARANGALRKLGAIQEGVLRHSKYCDGAWRDHVLWAIVAGDRSPARDLEPRQVH